MPAPERVRPLKVEGAGTGGDPADDDPVPAPLDPLEDALSARGLYVQRDGGPEDSDVAVLRDAAGNLTFVDLVAGEVTLDSLINNEEGSGSFQATAESYGASTTTSQTFQTKLTLITPSITLGTYILQWFMEWETSDANKDIELTVVDATSGVTTLSLFQARNPIANARQPYAGIAILSNASGVKTFRLQYRRVSAQTTILTVLRARLALIRVS